MPTWLLRITEEERQTISLALHSCMRAMTLLADAPPSVKVEIIRAEGKTTESMRDDSEKARIILGAFEHPQ